MIFQLFRRTPQDDTITSLYGTIVAQARAPVFYQIYGVPDTVNGRFEMIVLHAILFLRRLNSEPEPARELGQAIFDRFCQDMDANLREMGVGDLAVPRTMKRFGEAFYGRKAVYEAALATEPDATLIEALARNACGPGADSAAGAVRLAVYVREAVRHLAAQDGAALLRGHLSFPTPAGVAAVGET
jgi:cytochrome b pre-mRNA-processing protein 3